MWVSPTLAKRDVQGDPSVVNSEGEPEYSTIATPTFVIRGARVIRPCFGMQSLSDLIHRSSLVTIAYGSPFLPSTHAPQLAKHIAAHVHEADE